MEEPQVTDSEFPVHISVVRSLDLVTCLDYARSHDLPALIHHSGKLLPGISAPGYAQCMHCFSATRKPGYKGMFQALNTF